jgi:hypothetical protein
MAVSGRLPHSVEVRARAELNRMLRGKSPAQAQAIKRQLKRQARAKVRGNSRALAAIDQRFDARFASLLRNSPGLRIPVMAR